MPGRSLTRPPRTSTTECSCRLCPSPGMYAVTSIWLVRRTRQTFRRAEFGFLGVVVYTRVHTPRRWGAATFFLRPLPDFRPGVASFFFGAWRPLRTSWEVVGIRARRIATALFQRDCAAAREGVVGIALGATAADLDTPGTLPLVPPLRSVGAMDRE